LSRWPGFRYLQRLIAGVLGDPQSRNPAVQELNGRNDEERFGWISGACLSEATIQFHGVAKEEARALPASI